MRRLTTGTLVALLCVAAPAHGQNRDGADSLLARGAWQWPPTVEAATNPDGQLQLRLRVDEHRGLRVVEVEYFGEPRAAVLLVGGLGTESSLAEGVTVLDAWHAVPMVRMNGMRLGARLDARVARAEAPVYAQAVVVDAYGRPVRSEVVDLRLPTVANPPRALHVPPMETGVVVLDRTWPMPSTYELQVSVEVTCSDWDLTHHTTVLGPNGTDVYLVLKRPGPHEGYLDVVETHTVAVQLGTAFHAPTRLHVATTTRWNPAPGSLQFVCMGDSGGVDAARATDARREAPPPR